MPRTSEKERVKILKLESRNYSICEISNLTKIHKATVSRVILRFKERGNLEHRKSPGRPRKFTGRLVDRTNTLDSLKEPHRSAAQTQNSSHLNISR